MDCKICSEMFYLSAFANTFNILIMPADGMYTITISFWPNHYFLLIEIYLLFIESRQRGRFAGFSLYVSKHDNRDSSSLCYKDGPDLPPLNFTTTCITSGRYITFYNERLGGETYPSGYETINVFTELCEVIVYGNFTGALMNNNFMRRFCI